jgi:RNA polymerase sigma-70 factor (ECF subfamily)
MDETALIGAARQGDLNAFNSLILFYQDLVFNHALRVMGESEAAEDATQEAFISAYRNLSGYRGGSFRAWLLRIVTNACYDELRRRKRRPTTPLEPVDEDGEELESPRWMIDMTEMPEDELERAELARAIQHCLNSLPMEFKAAVVSVDVQGLDYTEVADVLKVPLGTVKSRLARARLKLRDCLRGFWELLPAEYRLGTE